jgi:Sigma-70, region 4
VSTNGDETPLQGSKERERLESDTLGPEQRLLLEEDKQSLRRAMEELPVALREVLLLREPEGLSYMEIAAIAEIPMGTVMSRLARGRERLYERLAGCSEGPSNRAAWIEHRLEDLAEIIAVAVGGFSVRAHHRFGPPQPPKSLNAPTALKSIAMG